MWQLKATSIHLWVSALQKPRHSETLGFTGQKTRYWFDCRSLLDDLVFLDTELVHHRHWIVALRSRFLLTSGPNLLSVPGASLQALTGAPWPVHSMYTVFNQESKTYFYEFLLFQRKVCNFKQFLSLGQTLLDIFMARPAVPCNRTPITGVNPLSSSQIKDSAEYVA